jgi:predicted permease
MSIDSLQQWFARFTAMFRRSRLERELDAELSAHLELAVEENLQRGMSAEEARRHALIGIGGMEQAREHHREARGLQWLDTFFQDVRYALRGVFKNPAFTAAAVLTLAFGIGVNASMFSMVSAFLLRRPPGRDPDRVVVISSVNPAGGMLADVNGVSAPNYLAWRRATDFYEDIAASEDDAVGLTWQGRTIAVESAAVTPDYFNVLKVSPLLGRVFASGDDQPGRDHIVILSHQLWDRDFGSDPSIIGRVVRLNREDYTVTGVMPDSFRLLGMTPQLWTPLVLTSADQTAAARRHRLLNVYARLKPGVSLLQVRAEMAAVAQRAEQEFPDTEKGWGIGVRTLPDFLIYVFHIGSALVVMMTVVGFILLIACANVAGLLLARAGARRKEIAIRMSLGAGRLRIVRHLLTEGVIIAFLGGGLGLVLAFWGIKFLHAKMTFNPEISAVPLRLDWNVLVFALVISAVSAIFCSLAPAVTASRTDLNSNLKDEARTASVGRSHTRLRSTLVTSEIAMALLLLIGTGLLLQAVLNQHRANLGFQQDHLLTARVALDQGRYPDRAQQRRFLEDLLLHLQQLPGAKAVAAVSNLPATGAHRATFIIQGQPDLPSDKRPRAVDFVVTQDYFRTAAIPLLRGRTFTAEDNDGTPGVVIVNQRFVDQYFNGQDPLGKQVRLDVGGMGGAASSSWSRIIGVVSNVKFHSEDAQYTPDVYETFLQRPISSFSLMIRTNSDPEGLAPALRKTVAQADPELPLSRIASMSSILEQQGSGDMLFVQMLGAFALLALILAAIGVYGLIAYSVGQRTHEIAIRVALGARSIDVRRMILRQGLKMASIGAAIGFIVALPLPRLFASMFDGMDTNYPQTFVLVLVLILLVAILATYIPARRASSIDPIRALRSE